MRKLPDASGRPLIELADPAEAEDGEGRQDGHGRGIVNRVMSTTDFYDGLAPWYHLLNPDWEGAIQRHGAVLARLLEETCGGPHPLGP